MKLENLLFALAVGAVLTGCRTVPMTGRTQLMLSTQGTENAQGATAYGEYVAQNKISTNKRYTEALNRCGNAVKSVAGQDDFEWEFKLFESKTENAFCLPGGKVAFYTGLVDKMENEAEMAFVMSHEVAHAIARHGGESVSWEQLRTLGGLLVSIGFGSDAANTIYSAGTQLGVTLPFSRSNEAEADYMGLLLMAKAGYNPDAAPAFWKRFTSGQSSSAVEGLLSTHPTDESRIKAMEDNLPAAREEYIKAPNKRGYGEKLR